jgi:hypothetical protein
MSWPTTADGLWYIFDGQVLVPVDPSTGASVIMLRPQGGIAQGVGAIATGPPGAAATFQTGAIPFTELAASDPTPASITVTQVSPGVYALSGALHAGAAGANGTTSIDLTTISGTAVAGEIIKVNTGATGFSFDYEAVAERYVPASISTTNTSGTTACCTVAIPARNRDYRVFVTGYNVVTQSGGSDVRVDLVARLNSTSGNIVARCPGIGGTERLQFSSTPPAGSADSFDKVTAGNAANIYIRVEQQSGANTYTTSTSTAAFAVWAMPVG